MAVSMPWLGTPQILACSPQLAMIEEFGCESRFTYLSQIATDVVTRWSSTVAPNGGITSLGERRPPSNHSYTRTSALRSTFAGESNL
jgi:hypothetical protein